MTGQEMRKIRESLELTKAAVACGCGLSTTTIRNLESNKQTLPATKRQVEAYLLGLQRDAPQQMILEQEPQLLNASYGITLTTDKLVAAHLMSSGWDLDRTQPVKGGTLYSLHKEETP